ncbi:hypothetical protein ACVWXL_009226 [Bradyrhizobium sp. GM22.5]
MEAPAPSRQARQPAGRLIFGLRPHKARRAPAHASIRRSSAYALPNDNDLKLARARVGPHVQYSLEISASALLRSRRNKTPHSIRDRISGTARCDHAWGHSHDGYTASYCASGAQVEPNRAFWGEQPARIMLRNAKRMRHYFTTSSLDALLNRLAHANNVDGASSRASSPPVMRRMTPGSVLAHATPGCRSLSPDRADDPTFVQKAQTDVLAK